MTLPPLTAFFISPSSMSQPTYTMAR
jgi:hypothetical protein